ncbi:MAG TPA: hypothetical protein VMX18_04895 [Candidatus Bipolaricaulota bacterium]|nr:hypothetical protein [Candidatus Bipolaricaulota bacterium]
MEGKNNKNLEQEMLQIKSMVKQNTEYTRKALELAEKTQKYVLWIKIINLIKLLIILLPIILALIYLPSFLREFFEQYKELFGAGGIFYDKLIR